jgi:peptidoglycan/LPS O-acetylase OafA/YrhL
MSAAAPARPTTVITIQYLRAIAASVVVLYHAMSAPSIVALFLVRIGEFGVDLFFVISGYIMWTTTAGSGRGPLAFSGARLLRVAPLYWIFTTLYMAIAFLRPDAVFNAAIEPLHIVKSYLFVPAVGRIREAVTDEHDVFTRHIALIRPNTLPKTTSGKIQRSVTRKLWLEHRLDYLTPEPA